MSSAKLTLLGMYNFFEFNHDSLFKNMTVPSFVDKDTLIDNILLHGGEFEVLYSDGYFLQNAIGAWSRKYQRTFEKWSSALSLQYKINENSRLSDVLSQTGSGTDNVTHTKSDHMTGSNDRTFSSTDHTETDATNTDQVSAFDSTDFNNKSRNVADGSTTGSSGGTDNVSSDVTNTGTGSDNKVVSNKMDSERTTSGISGKSNQELISEELELAKWNIYQNIEDLFITEFCIMVYE